MTPADREAIGDAAVAFARTAPGSTDEWFGPRAELASRLSGAALDLVAIVARRCFAAGIEEGLARARREREAAMLDRARGLG